MVLYFIKTSFLLTLYRVSIKYKLYNLTDLVEEKLEKYNIYIHKNIKIINVMILSDWFFDDFHNHYKHLYNDKRYYVLYKLFPAENNSLKRIRTSAIYKRNNVLKNDGYKCKCCHTTDDLTIDHIIPVSKGGDSSYFNLQTLCNRCNSIKGDNIISIELLRLVVKEKLQNKNKKTTEIFLCQN